MKFFTVMILLNSIQLQLKLDMNNKRFLYIIILLVLLILIVAYGGWKISQEGQPFGKPVETLGIFTMDYYLPTDNMRIELMGVEARSKLTVLIDDQEVSLNLSQSVESYLNSNFRTWTQVPKGEQAYDLIIPVTCKYFVLTLRTGTKGEDISGNVETFKCRQSLPDDSSWYLF